MKRQIKSLLAAAVLLTAAGCDRDMVAETYDGSYGDPAAAYFEQSNVSIEFENTTVGDKPFVVRLYRANGAGELTVGLDQVVSDDAEPFFEIPAEATFANGALSTDIEVTVKDIDQFAKGKTYTATITVGDHHDFTELPELEATDIKLARRARATRSSASIGAQYASTTISATLILDWGPAYLYKDPTKLLEQKPEGTPDADWYKMGDDGKPLQMEGTFIYNGWWGGDDYQTIERAEGTNVFRYTNWGGGVNLIFSILDEMITVDGQQYHRVMMSEQYIGADDDTYGPVYVSTSADYHGGSDAAIAQYPSYWDGENMIYLTNTYSVSGGYFGDEFLETIEFSTGEAPEPAPEIDIVYDGASESITGVKSHSLSFAPNADVVQYKATVVKNDLVQVDMEMAAEETIAFLEYNGITQDNPRFYSYYVDFLPQFYDELFQASLESLFETLAPKIADGSITDESGFKVVTATEAGTYAWELGADEGMYTAVAIGYVADDEGNPAAEPAMLNAKAFLYNPAADASKYQYEAYASAEADYLDPSLGYMSDNAVFFNVAAKQGDAVAMRYALMTSAAYAELTDEAAKLAYLEENGSSLSAEEIEELNAYDPVLIGGFATYLDAEPSTDYTVLFSLTMPDATVVDAVEATTSAALPKSALEVTLSSVASDVPNPSTGGVAYYAHESLLATFEASYVLGGKYLIAPLAELVEGGYFTVDGDTIAPAGDVTDTEMVELINADGSDFTTGDDVTYYDESDLYAFNTDGIAGFYVDGLDPGTQYVLLSYVNTGEEGSDSEWKWASARVAFAPSVTFTQSVTGGDGYADFKWIGGKSGVYAIGEVVYAFVPASEFAATGLDASNIGNPNDLEAREAAGEDVTADAATAATLNAFLAASGKTLKDDALKPVNTADGFSRRFADLSAGDYVLVSRAADSYNTKITVSPVTVR